MIDTHIHAPQFPNTGLGYDKTLLEWLINYTFPLESKYNDTAFAKHVYEAVVVSFLIHSSIFQNVILIDVPLYEFISYLVV